MSKNHKAVSDDHETTEIPRSVADLQTQNLVQPVAVFKRPNQKVRLETSIAHVRFIMPMGESVDIPAGSYIVLGRQEGNERHVDLDLSELYGPESGISRTHAVLQITNNSVFIRDFDSTNGTFLNGAELYAMRDYPLNDGDEIKLGKVTMRVIFLH